jgi:hypothetical protein
MVTLVGFGLAPYPLTPDESHVIFSFWKSTNEWLVCYLRGKTIGIFQREAKAFKLGESVSLPMIEDLIIQKWDINIPYSEFKKRVSQHTKECHSDIQLEWLEDFRINGI